MERKERFLLYLILFSLFFTACTPEDGPTTKPSITTSESKTITATYDISKTKTFKFSSSDAWTINASDDEMTVSPLSGKAGDHTVSVKLNKYNCTNVTYDYFFTINSENSLGSSNMKVTVRQDPVFNLEKTYFEADPEGGTIRMYFNTDGEVSKGFYVYFGKNDDAQEMMARESSSRADSGYKYWIDFPVTKNTESRQRSGYFCFGLDQDAKQLSAPFQITQLPSDIACSKDTVTNDGIVKQLQKHTIGKGVPLVIMGDGFIDIEVADGTYDDAMKLTYEYFFNIDPMTKLKDYFDVYYVTAVSYNNVFSSTTRTAFKSVFEGGSSTQVLGDNEKVLTYAEKAISTSIIDDAVIIVVLNDTRNAGTCVLTSIPEKSSIPSGYSIAYLPMTEYSESTQVGFEQILHHEAIGHGFAKLADEYNRAENGTITNEAKKKLEQSWEYGFCRNLSLSSEVNQTFWSDLASDTRYSSESLGCYEGGYTYFKGVWRATDANIMRHNIGGFNAQQRRLIYNRCMRIANGTSWQPTYEDFVAFDQKSTSNTSSAKQTSKVSVKEPTMFLPPTPPIIKIRK